MPTSGPARTRARRRRIAGLTVLVVVGAVFVGFALDRSSATAGGGALAVPNVVARAPLPAPTRGSVAPDVPDRLPRNQQSGLSDADGLVPHGVTIFDDRYPAVANL